MKACVISLYNVLQSFAGNVAIEVLPPIETKNLTTKDIPKLIEDTNAKMLNVFRELSIQQTPLSVIELRRNYLSKCV